MTTQEFIQRVSKWENYLNNGFQKDALLRGCMDLVAKIETRVRETGVTGEGKRHNYSTKPILVGAKSFQTRGAFSKAMAMTKTKDSPTHWITYNGYHLIRLEGGYKMVRALEGLPVGSKNYSRTTEMWRGFGVKAKQKNKIEIGGRTSISQDKINWNSERDKDNIIAANNTEIDALTLFVSNQIKEFINASFGSK